MDSVLYQIIPRRSPWNYALLLNRPSIKWHKFFRTLYDFINIIRHSGPFFLIAAIFEKIGTYNLFEDCFPFPSEHIGLSQHISTVIPHVLFAKFKPVLIIVSKLFCAFRNYKFRCSCTDVISHYVETNSAFNLVLQFLFDILRLFVISWWFSDTDSKQTARRSVCKKCQSAPDKLQSALYTFTVAGISHIKWL